MPEARRRPVFENRYSLVKPCAHCPFRTDVPPYLYSSRAREIADSINGGGEFPCHKTTVASENEEGEEILVDDLSVSKICAGSLAIMIREGQLNQMAQIAHRLGMWNPENFDAGNLPVYDSFEDWVHAHVEAERHSIPGATRPARTAGHVDDDDNARAS